MPCRAWSRWERTNDRRCRKPGGRTAHPSLAIVLGSIIREEQGIYLWLQIDGVDEPRSYVLAWNRDLAEELQAARREAEENDSDLRMTMRFEPSWDDREQKFYAYAPARNAAQRDYLRNGSPRIRSSRAAGLGQRSHSSAIERPSRARKFWSPRIALTKGRDPILFTPFPAGFQNTFPLALTALKEGPTKGPGD